MNMLASFIASSTVQVWEAFAVTALAVVPMPSGQAARAGKPKLRSGKRKSPNVELDRHTRRDIGVEPGSITWM